MHGKAVLVALSAAAMVSAREAPVTSNNPSGDVYEAVLPATPFFAGGPKIQGSISAQAGDNGRGVKFNVHFEGIPAEGGPFTYHLHLKAATDGNCTSTATHLDPYEAGTAVACDSSNPAICEVGDLSGKHGKIQSAGTYDKTYQDDFASTSSSDPAFFGNKAFVLHYGGNNTRITCANFAKKSSGGNSTTTSRLPTGTGSPIIPSTSAPASNPTTSSPPINAAGRLSSWSTSAMIAVAGGAAMYFGL